MTLWNIYMFNFQGPLHPALLRCPWNSWNQSNLPYKFLWTRDITISTLNVLWTHNYVSFWSIEIPKKVFGVFDNIFRVYLMRRFQKYERNLFLTVAFWGQTKAGQKWAARWAELAVLFCRYSKASLYAIIVFWKNVA